MQKFKPSFYLKPQHDGISNSYPSLNPEIAQQSAAYSSCENMLEKNRDLVQSILLEHNYLSSKIAENNKNLVKNEIKTKKPASKQLPAKIARKLDKSVEAVGRKSNVRAMGSPKVKSNAKTVTTTTPRKARPVEQASFSPMLNKKSLVIAAKLREFPRETIESMAEQTANFSSLINSRPTNFNGESDKFNSIATRDRSQNFAREASEQSYLPTGSILTTEKTPSNEDDFLFRPKINKKSKIIEQARDKSAHKSRDQMLYEDYLDRQRRLKDTKLRLEEKELQEQNKACSFMPKIKAKQNSNIINDEKVEDRLLVWQKNKEIKQQKAFEEVKATADLKNCLASKKPEKLVVDEDLSFANKPSVQKGIAKFLAQKEFARQKRFENESLREKHCVLRGNANS